jgi:hypothetical protein
VTELERLAAIEEIKQAKARYFRGVDTSDGALVRSILAEDCVLDYMGCCTDPKTGQDFFPEMNRVMQGRASWGDGGFADLGIVTSHQGHNCEISFTSDATADVVWSMTDLMFFPEGARYSRLAGHGWYHETYAKEADGRWRIKATRIVRSRVEAV